MITRDFAARQTRYATYLFAGQTSNHLFPAKPATAIRGGDLPPGISSPANFDFLDPANPFFHTDRALFSAGQFMYGTTPTGMFDRRPGITILGDSGGYQLIQRPQLWRGDYTRAWVLNWLEQHTDEGMTLDIPTMAIQPNSAFLTFDAALGLTLDSLTFFDKHQSGKARLLNFQQGRTKAEALKWYDATKAYPFGGWAFGGDMRGDFLHLVSMLDRMRQDGLLGRERNRIHILGKADLPAAVALSAIQEGLREALNDDEFLITFDTSSPMFMLSVGDAYGFPSFGPSTFNISTWKPASVQRAYGNAGTLPIKSSAIASSVRVSDLSVTKQSLAQSAWDGLGEAIVANHNLHSLLSAIEMANDVLALHPTDARGLAPSYVIDACYGLRRAFRHADPVSYLSNYRGDLARL